MRILMFHLGSAMWCKFEEHDLVFDLDLGPGDWVVSSHSTDSMFGKFSLRFQEPQAIELIGSMEEFPPPRGRWNISVSWTSK